LPACRAGPIVHCFFVIAREHSSNTAEVTFLPIDHRTLAPSLDLPSGGAPAAADPETPCARELEACLKLKTDLWIFGYGSLMWHPGFPYCASEAGLLRGWHRSFCVFSHSYRGTPEKPGLVLGLDRGGACRGMAFRIPATDIATAMAYLWEREMTGGVYELRELPIETAQGRIKARAFVVRRAHAQYAGRLSVEATARLILQGIGARGHCREYLANTVRQLEELGLVDGPLHRLELKVKELAALHPPCPG
jgi:cation transport protein ChaC